MSRGEHLVHAVTELVRERHHVARAAVVIEQDVWVRRGHGRVREGAARLARPERGIDPRPLEETAADLRHFGAERRVGIEHAAPRRIPVDLTVVVLRQRRVAIPVLQPGQAKPARLQGVIAMRKRRIAFRHRRDQRIDHLVLDHVGAVAVAARARIVPPRVDDLLVLGERVGDQREQLQVLAERLADGAPGGLAHTAISVGELVESVSDGQLLARHRDAHPGDRLVEQPAPGAAAGNFFLVQ